MGIKAWHTCKNQIMPPKDEIIMVIHQIKHNRKILTCVIEEHDEMRVKWDARVSSKGENTLRGVNLGTFTTCFKSIHL